MMAYPARAGGPWLCRTLVRSGFHAVVVPSGLSTSVQPHRWITTWWWNEHSRTHSLRLVGPPWALCLTWCTSQAAAGWLQPDPHLGDPLGLQHRPVIHRPQLGQGDVHGGLDRLAGPFGEQAAGG